MFLSLKVTPLSLCCESIFPNYKEAFPPELFPESVFLECITSFKFFVQNFSSVFSKPFYHMWGIQKIVLASYAAMGTAKMLKKACPCLDSEERRVKTF